MSVPWDLAACAGMRTDLFFAQSYDTEQDKVDTARALSVCRACLIRDACLQDALDAEAGTGRFYRYGIRGGLKGGQRAKLPRPPRVEVRAHCGSPSGMKGHQRRGEAVCATCAEANRVYRRALAAKARAAA